LKKLVQSLKQDLDKIDKETYANVYSSEISKREDILMGGWRKGRKIFMAYAKEGIPSLREGFSFNYRAIEKLTGRGHTDLKRWVELFKNNLNEEKFYTEYAKPKAKEWTEKILLGQIRAIAHKVQGEKKKKKVEPPTINEFLQHLSLAMRGVDRNLFDLLEFEKEYKKEFQIAISENAKFIKDTMMLDGTLKEINKAFKRLKEDREKREPAEVVPKEIETKGKNKGNLMASGKQFRAYMCNRCDTIISEKLWIGDTHKKCDEYLKTKEKLQI